MTIPYLHSSETKLMVQVCKDLDRHEGYREFAYPDVLSDLYQQYPDQDWGFKPAAEILEDIGISEEAAERMGYPWTVGYGFTQGTNLHSRMTKQLATRRLEELVLAINNDLNKTLSWYKDASFVTKTILINMYFNMGKTKLLGFRNTLRYISQRQYRQAAANMLKSLWAKQVPRRARELARRMETQTISSEHLAPETT